MQFAVAARAPLISALIFSALFLLPQVREMLLVTISSSPTDIRYYAPAIVLAVYCLLLLLWSLTLCMEAQARTQANASDSVPPVIDLPRHVLTKSLFLAFWPLCTIAVMLGVFSFSAVENINCDQLVPILSDVCSFAQAEQIQTSDLIGKEFVVLIIGIVCVTVFVTYAYIVVDLTRLPQVSRFVSIAIFAVSLLFFVASTFNLTFRWAFVRYLGPIGVSLLFLCACLVVFSFLQRSYDRGSHPIVPYLLVLLIAVGFFDLNDIYFVRRIVHEKERKIFDPLMPPQDQRATTTVGDAFQEWLGARKTEIERYRAASLRFPVYIVTAEGGGLYAAYHVAYTLAGLHDRCPKFTKNLFAISGVSGGAVGASIFAALLGTKPVASHPENCQLESDKAESPMRDAARKLLSRDFLGPVLLDGLFSDVPRALLPLGALASSPALSKVIQPWIDNDRAVAFEDMLRLYWRQLIEESGKVGTWDAAFFGRPLSDTWLATDNRPALVLNATVVETGERFVLSPFSWRGTRVVHDDFSPFSFTIDPKTISLATAVGLSVRYPMISPPGAVKIIDDGGRQQKIRLADGGYYDNSGALTGYGLALELNAVLRETEFANDVQIVVLSFTTSRSAHFDQDAWPTSFNELATPVRTMFRVRALRAFSVIDAVQRGVNQPSGQHCRVFLLAGRKPAVPSAWYLSERSYRMVERQSGVGRGVDAGAFLGESNRAKADIDIGFGVCDVGRDDWREILASNQEVLRSISRDLNTAQ